MKHVIEIFGKPFAKQRPRMAKTGHVYTPKETVSFERVVGQIASEKIKDPLRGPVKLTVIAFFKIPKSWSKVKKADALKTLYHTSRPDYDNVLKAIADGLNRVAYVDDSQVAKAICVKLWTENDPKTRVIIENLSQEGTDE